MLAPTPLTANNLKRTFDMYDQDRSGFISLDEFRQILQRHNPHMDDRILMHLMQKYDTNRDGAISFSEFEEFMNLRVVGNQNNFHNMPANRPNHAPINIQFGSGGSHPVNIGIGANGQLNPINMFGFQGNGAVGPIQHQYQSHGSHGLPPMPLLLTQSAPVNSPTNQLPPLPLLIGNQPSPRPHQQGQPNHYQQHQPTIQQQPSHYQQQKPNYPVQHQNIQQRPQNYPAIQPTQPMQNQAQAPIQQNTRYIAAGNNTPTPENKPHQAWTKPKSQLVQSTIEHNIPPPAKR